MKKTMAIVLLLMMFQAIALNVVCQESETKDLSSGYTYYEMSGNKLFVYTDSDVYSFAPYGKEMLRIGFHFGQDTTYPASQSVVMFPEGDATLEASGNYLYYTTSGFLVIIEKFPLYFSVVSGSDTLLWQGEASESGSGSRMQFGTDPFSAWYGGGSRAIPMNRAGCDLQMLNAPFYGYSWGSDRLNICIPVAVSSGGFAVYFENPSPADMSLGASEPGLISYDAVSGPLSCFVIRTADPDSLTEPFTALTGRQSLPPIWALGYIQSKFGYENATEAADVVDGMRAEGFPMDAIIFDLQWQGGVSEMGNLAWDLGRFPDPEGMMLDFRQKGVKSVCVADSYFTENCHFFTFLSDTGWFARDTAGAPYILDNFWAGTAGLLDVTATAAADWYWGRCKNLMEGGVTGLWTDLGEPELAPDDMVFCAGSATDVRQVYNLTWSGAIYDRFTADYPDSRLFILTRSGYAGMQRYSTFPWSGDVAKSFDGLRSQIPIMLGMGLCGVGFMHADIGGFAGDYDPVLYTRWQEMGAFVPVMRAHGTGVPTEPIYYPEPYKSIVKEFIRLRYEMLPYNYTLAYDYCTTGMPMARPLFFEDAGLTSVDDEYLWGNDFLVAPVTEENAGSRQVIFPPGKWIDYFHLDAYPGGQTRTIDVPLDYLPVFVRAGVLVPMIPVILHTEEYLSDRYRIHYFADPDVKASSARIYIDDGLTRQATTQGKFSMIKINADYQAEHAQIAFIREGIGFTGEPMQKEMTLEIERAGVAPSAVSYNDVPVTIVPDSLSYDQLQDAALYLADRHQILVKVLWDSQSAGLIRIDRLQITNEFSVPEMLAPGVTFYPNPVKVDGQVNIGLRQGGRYRFELFTLAGRSIGQYDRSYPSAGSYSVAWQEMFPVHLPVGTYILKITSSGGDDRVLKIILI
jgi:oligosaccharide 4-alpha-D-glucosyltransferase